MEALHVHMRTTEDRTMDMRIPRHNMQSPISRCYSSTIAHLPTIDFLRILAWIRMQLCMNTTRHHSSRAMPDMPIVLLLFSSLRAGIHENESLPKPHWPVWSSSDHARSPADFELPTQSPSPVHFCKPGSSAPSSSVISGIPCLFPPLMLVTSLLPVSSLRHFLPTTQGAFRMAKAKKPTIPQGQQEMAMQSARRAPLHERQHLPEHFAVSSFPQTAGSCLLAVAVPSSERLGAAPPDPFTLWPTSCIFPTVPWAGCNGLVGSF